MSKPTALSAILDHLDTAALAELAAALLQGGHSSAETVTHLVELADAALDLRTILPAPWGALGEAVDGPLLTLVVTPIVRAAAKRRAA